MHGSFEKIYSLVRRRRYGAALDLLYDRQSHRLNGAYKSDANHAWYRVGEIFYKQGKYREALDAFRKGLRTRPEDAYALWAIADCYSDMGRPKLAERYYRKAKALAGQEWALTYDIGSCLFDQGRYREAIALYKKIPSSESGAFKLARKNMELAQSRMRPPVNPRKASIAR